jgi:hypothetical protein
MGRNNLSPTRTGTCPWRVQTVPLFFLLYSLFLFRFFKRESETVT